jgi:hypothetical protein
MRDFESIIDKLQKKILGLPFALSSEEWKEWHNQTSSLKPIAYAIIYKFPLWFERSFIDPFKLFKYWVQYRVDPDYRKYWTVTPSTLKIGYNDPSELLLHTSFQILCDFYEYQISDRGFIDWDSNDETKKQLADMKELYVYWKSHHIGLEKIEDFYSVYSLINCEKERHLYSEFLHKQEKSFKEKETLMLKKLIDIRHTLYD